MASKRSRPPSPGEAMVDKGGKWDAGMEGLSGEEKALLKPSLPGNTHVLNLAAFSQIRDEASKSQPKRTIRRSQSFSRSTTAETALRSPTGSDLGARQDTTEIKIHQPSPPSPAGQTSKRESLSQTAPAAPQPRKQGQLAPLAKALTARTHDPTTSGVDLGPLRKGDLTTLMTLAQPTPAFQALVRSLKVAEYMDVSWLANLNAGLGPPVPRLSLDSFNDDVLTKGDTSMGKLVLLNSPRSVLACLRSGINPIELQQRPPEYFATENAQVVPEVVAQKRKEFYERQRAIKVKIVREEYDNVRASIDTDEVLNFFRRYDPKNPSSSLKLHLSLDRNDPNASKYGDDDEQGLQMKRAKFKKMLEGQKREIEKRINYAKELREQLKTAAEERAKFEAALRAKREADKLEKERSALEQKQKQEEWKRQLAKAEEERIQEAALRAERMAEKERLRQEAMREMNEAKKQEMLEKSERNAERLLKNKTKQNQLINLKRQQFEAKEAAAEQKKREQEAAKAAEREALKAKAAQVAEHQRQIAEQAAARLAHRKAEYEAKGREAEERLAQFHLQEEKRREEQRTEERRKNEKRKNIFRAAREDEEQKKQVRLEKQHQQQEHFDKLMADRLQHTMLSNEEAACIRSEKLDHVQRKQKMRQYEQLRTIDALQRKRDNIEKSETRKLQLVKETLQERRDMELAKAKMLANLEKQETAL